MKQLGRQGVGWMLVAQDRASMKAKISFLLLKGGKIVD
jgi:hypothetical protein